jgi:hypothetical protein
MSNEQERSQPTRAFIRILGMDEEIQKVIESSRRKVFIGTSLFLTSPLVFTVGTLILDRAYNRPHFFNLFQPKAAEGLLATISISAGVTNAVFGGGMAAINMSELTGAVIARYIQGSIRPISNSKSDRTEKLS